MGRGGGSRGKCEWQIGGELDWQAGGCGEESYNHEELLKGWGRGAEGLSGWRCSSCELPATLMKRSSTMQMKDLIRQLQCKSSAKASFLQTYPFSLYLIVMTVDLYQEFIKP